MRTYTWAEDQPAGVKWLGFQIQRSSFRFKKVKDGSPAELAGIQNDDLCLQVNGYLVANLDVEELCKHMESRPLTITWLRHQHIRKPAQP